MSVIPYAKKEELELKSIHAFVLVVRHMCELWVVLHPHLFIYAKGGWWCFADVQGELRLYLLVLHSLNSSFLADLMDDPLM